MFRQIDMSRYLNSPREADWYACPTCGDEVRVGSSGCRKCLSLPQDAQDGAWPDGVDLPEQPDDFDYEDWKKREFGKAAQIKPHHLPWKYWLTGICLLAALVWGWIIVGFLQR
jgi:hypothetical protein